MKKLSELSLADLIAIKDEFKEDSDIHLKIACEITKRLVNIDFDN